MKLDQHLIIGLVLLFLGVVFLADNFDFMPDFFDIGLLWPVFVIGGGVMIILEGRKKEGSEAAAFLAGGAAILIGVFFLLRNYQVIPYSFHIGKLWPLALLAAGVWFLFIKDKNK